MPGLANMESTSSGVRDKSSIASSHAAYTSQPPVKAEEDEFNDLQLNGDGYEDEGSYKPRPQLPQPSTVLRPLKYLLHADIDVDPEYQREVVWTADRMTGLINSLMENYYIPPIILNRKPQSTSNGAAPGQRLVCVDGKQRLSSVKAFVQGIIPCHDHRGEKWWFCIAHEVPGSRHKRILPEVAQKEFIDKEFVSFEYTGLSQEQEEDLFARVQMGVQLTAAEKMRASTGPWQELARCYVDDFPIIYSLLKDRARAKDFQITLSCFSQIVEVQHRTAANGIPSLKTTHNNLPRLLENKNALDDGLKSHLASVWVTFQDLIELHPNTFTNADKRLRGVQTFAPIEMVAVTVLISMYSESHNNRLLIRDIQALRDALRENFSDLRLNTSTWKFVWKFIDNLEQIGGAVDGSTVDHTRTHTVEGGPVLVREASPPVKRSRPTAGTKPVTVLPGSNNRVELAAATLHTDSRPQKRPRVEPVLASPYSESSLPTSSNTIGTTSTPIEGGNPKSHVLSASTPRRIAPPTQKPTNQHPTVIPPLAHSKAHRNQPNSPRAPTAPMWPTFPFGSLEQRSSAPLPSPTMPPPPRNIQATASPVIPTSLHSMKQSPVTQPTTKSPFFKSGPIRPPSTQPPEVLHSTSPIPVHTIPTAPAIRTTPRPHSDARARLIPQYDGVVDLTSDDEEEGQHLLALFKAKASVSKSAEKNSLRSPTGSLGLNQVPQSQRWPQQPSPEVQEVGYNNPYQQRKEFMF